MKRFCVVNGFLAGLLYLTCLFGTLFALSSPARGATLYPQPTGFVTDTTGLLPQQTRQGLEAKLKQYEASTSIEIAIVVIPTLSDATAHDYADGLWKQWGIGKKGQDNGVLLLVVPPPEKIAWIQTGYGIQGWLTDVQCKHIVDDVMKPLNLQEKRPEAVVAGVVAIMSKLGETPWATRATMKPPGDDDGGNFSIGVVLVIVVICVLFFVFVASYDDGGIGGGYYGRSSGGSSSSSSSSSSDSGGGFGGFGGGGSGGGGGGGGSG